MTDIFRSGLRCLFGRKVRSFLTIAGIAIGVMSVVLVSAIGELGTSSINEELSGMGMDSLVVSVQSGSGSRLTESELDSIKALEQVDNAMPLMSVVTSGTIKNEKATVMAWGVNEDADNVIDLEVLYGRLLNRGDILEKNRVCVIDEAIALEHYKRANIVGKHITVTIGGVPISFEVVGVVKNGVNTLQNMLGGFIPDFVYLPYSVMQDLLGRDYFDQITVRLEDSSTSDEAVTAVKTVLSEGYSVDDLLSQKEKLSGILSIASAALSAVAGISLIVSGISIMTVMLVSVSERTAEIGIKKSIGASRGVILAEFLAESELMTLIGALGGILLGTALSAVLFAALGRGFAVNWRLCGGVLLISLVIGGAFGAYPAYKAASLRPVDALRRE